MAKEREELRRLASLTDSEGSKNFPEKTSMTILERLRRGEDKKEVALWRDWLAQVSPLRT